MAFDRETERNLQQIQSDIASRIAKRDALNTRLRELDKLIQEARAGERERDKIRSELRELDRDMRKLDETLRALNQEVQKARDRAV